MRRSVASLCLSFFLHNGRPTEADASPSESSTTHFTLKKTQVLCASATGLCLVATKGLFQSKVFCLKEGVPTTRDSPEDEKSLELSSVEPSLAVHRLESHSIEPEPESEPSSAAVEEEIPEASDSPPVISKQLTLSPSNALEQLKAIMPAYHDSATYEDNFLSMSGARCIFYHFLTMIWLFLSIKIDVNDIKTEELAPKKLLYTVASSRKFIMRRFPLIHYFLPECIDCEVLTTCRVESGLIVHHYDRYSKLRMSWRIKVPGLLRTMKALTGKFYVCLLNVLYCAFDLCCIVICAFGFKNKTTVQS